MPLAKYLPVRQPPFGLAMWWLYATVPLLLPRGFPLELPLAHTIIQHWSRLLVRLRLPTSTLSTTSVVRLFWVCLALVATRISVVLEINSYATQPYACADPAQPARWVHQACIGTVLASDGWVWSLRAALADGLACAANVVAIVGMASATPRVQLPMLTWIGQHSLLVLIAHTFASPFLVPMAHACGACCEVILTNTEEHEKP